MTGQTYEQLFGEPVARVNMNSQGAIGQAVPAFSTLPSPREGFCKANDDTCGARRVKDSEYCIGHKRAAEKDES